MDSAHEETPPRWRAGRQKLLPGDIIGRLKADLGTAIGMEPVVVYADDLRILIEVVENGPGPDAEKTNELENSAALASRQHFDIWRKP